MRRWSVRQLIFVFVGAIVALGISMSMVNAGDMANVSMDMPVMSAGMAPIDCQGDIKADACEAGMTSCALVCAGHPLLLPLLIASVPNIAQVSDAFALDAKILVGTTHPPELSPPRSADVA